jgi:hypothetical protein
MRLTVRRIVAELAAYPDRKEFFETTRASKRKTSSGT